MFNNTKNLYKTFVVDQITFGILTETSSISVANAICKGMLNTSQMTVPFDYDLNETTNYILIQPKVIQKHGEANTAKIVDRVEGYKRFSVESFEPDNEFLKKKELAKIRKYGLDLLEKNISRFLSRNQNYVDTSGLMITLSLELPKCFPEKNSYTPAILEWAIASKIDNRSAYNFLKMQYDCYATSVLRFYALWNKYVDRINQLDNKRDVHICALYEFEDEVYAAGEGE